MSASLLFPDPRAASDALTFAQRAARLGDGTVRLHADRGTLTLTCAPLAPRALGEPTPTILGLRAVRTDPELVCDLVVDAATLAPGEDPSRVSLPATAVTAAWAGVSPPRAGWTAVGQVPAARLAARAQGGIAAVAERMPTDAGEEVVHAIRSDVWGQPDETMNGLPSGVAFAAFALGFIRGEEEATIHQLGPWTRVSLVRGHVLTRTIVRSGLTPVRPTGAPA
ncbi:hypothetical protein [Microbacterium sp. TNHR37B]|uniref:hypothetical protein n=1 Tax=Microbacterium sp. TNHR37B TaxID=1775956 RepID=UPI0007B2FA1E|nr:hypothetical protein [Microbacterium sp. TNHR37B]KZE91026.1 hypothetical protein AVP41_00557 [Microbacterium sp. TNHR37B]